MDRPRETPFFQSINRPNLLMAADRELVLFAATISAMLIFPAPSATTITIGVVFWFVAIAVFRKMAKADPLMKAVYMKHITYRSYYPPKSSLRVEDYTTPNNWRSLRG